MKGDPSHLFEEHPERVLVHNKVQKWAAQNAYTLIFLSIMFFITWLVTVVSQWIG